MSACCICDLRCGGSLSSLSVSTILLDGLWNISQSQWPRQRQSGQNFKCVTSNFYHRMIPHFAVALLLKKISVGMLYSKGKNYGWHRVVSTSILVQSPPHDLIDLKCVTSPSCSIAIRWSNWRISTICHLNSESWYATLWNCLFELLLRLTLLCLKMRSWKIQLLSFPSMSLLPRTISRLFWSRLHPWLLQHHLYINMVRGSGAYSKMLPVQPRKNENEWRSKARISKKSRNVPIKRDIRA